MSQVLIISDSHFLRKNELEQFISRFPHIIATIHCGDIYIGYQENDLQNFYICKGNNDFGNLNKINHFMIDGVTFTITHGHLNNFAYNPLSLTELLEQYPADVICFGHTHIPYLHKENNLTILNPGSLTLGRTFPRLNTYVLFETQTKEIHFYNAKTFEEIKINEN